MRKSRVVEQNRCYHLISRVATARTSKTGLPFWIGQDGTGKCKVSLKGDVDDFALWTRSLSREEVRRIHDAGRKGHDLGLLVKAR